MLLASHPLVSGESIVMMMMMVMVPDIWMTQNSANPSS